MFTGCLASTAIRSPEFPSVTDELFLPSVLEQKVLDMEDKHSAQLQSMKEDKAELQVLVSKQNSIIKELEKQLVTATVNTSALQKQQLDLMETVQNLMTMITTPNCK